MSSEREDRAYDEALQQSYQVPKIAPVPCLDIYPAAAAGGALIYEVVRVRWDTWSIYSDQFNTEMIEQLWNKTVLAGLLLSGLAIYLTFIVCWEHLQIRLLGGRAPIIWGKLPFGKACLLRVRKVYAHQTRYRSGHRLHLYSLSSAR